MLVVSIETSQNYKILIDFADKLAFFLKNICKLRLFYWKNYEIKILNFILTIWIFLGYKQFYFCILQFYWHYFGEIFKKNSSRNYIFQLF